MAQAVSLSVITYGGMKYRTLPSGRSSRPRSRNAARQARADVIEVPAGGLCRLVRHQLDDADAADDADVADRRQRGKRREALAQPALEVAHASSAPVS